MQVFTGRQIRVFQNGRSLSNGAHIWVYVCVDPRSLSHLDTKIGWKVSRKIAIIESFVMIVQLIVF